MSLNAVCTTTTTNTCRSGRRIQLRACTLRTMMPTMGCQCPCDSNSVCRQATLRLQGEMPARRRSTRSGRMSVSKWSESLTHPRPVRKRVKQSGWRLVEQAGVAGAKGTSWAARAGALWWHPVSFVWKQVHAWSRFTFLCLAVFRTLWAQRFPARTVGRHQ